MVTCFFLEPSPLCRLRAFENFIKPKLGMQTSSLKLSTFVLISVTKKHQLVLFIHKVRTGVDHKSSATDPAKKHGSGSRNSDQDSAISKLFCLQGGDIFDI